MVQSDERQVFVGQKGVKHHGADVEIVTVTPDGKEVKVTYPYAPSKRPAWVKTEDLTLPQTLFNSPMVDSPKPELYPVGAVLSNGAGESVKVVDRFKQDVKLQLGTVSGALTTDFQPSEDEPFTMSETDLTEWLSKTLPSAAADTVPLDSPVTLYTWLPGQRARLLQDLPGDPWPLFEGDEGVVVKSGGELGFKSDRWGATSKVRSLNGKTVRVLDYCEAVVADSLTPEVVPETDSKEAESDDVKALREQIKYLEKRIEGLLLDNKLLNGEHDDLMKALEDNGKLLAAQTDAEKRIQKLEAENTRLEKKNNQQSEMLREAVLIPTERQVQRVKTLMSTGGSDGFGETIIPNGYQIVAVTTEVYDGKLTRLIHLMGCGDSPAPLEDVSEKVTVEFEQVANSFEDLLRGTASVEDTIAVGNTEVMAAARQAAEARLNNFVPTELPQLEGVE